MDRQPLPLPLPRPRRKTPSFSSSLLDAIYHSIDEGRDGAAAGRRRNVEEEIESLRRAIMVEKWMEHYAAAAPRHLSSNSGSSTDSSAVSSSETESSAASRSSAAKSKHPGKTKQADSTPKREGRFTRTKSRAMKIYGDLKKVKEPKSPGGKIASFLNSIFSPRMNPKKNQAPDEDFHPVRKSKSMKDPTTSASCLSKTHSKSKRSVRFCPVSVIPDQDSCRNMYEECPVGASSIGSRFIKKNINSFRAGDGKGNVRRHEFREFYDNGNDVDDDRSCASSDLFELENIGRACLYEEELPVYGTTNVQMNQAIANNHRQRF